MSDAPYRKLTNDELAGLHLHRAREMIAGIPDPPFTESQRRNLTLEESENYCVPVKATELMEHGDDRYWEGFQAGTDDGYRDGYSTGLADAADEMRPTIRDMQPGDLWECST